MTKLSLNRLSLTKLAYAYLLFVLPVVAGENHAPSTPQPPVKPLSHNTAANGTTTVKPASALAAQPPLPPPKYSSQQLMSALVTKHTKRETESHPGGIRLFDEPPDMSGDLSRAWTIWIRNFRLEFERTLTHAVSERRPELYGNTRVVFSIDASRHLRCKIVDSNAPPFFSSAVLSVTRRLDGANWLAFPAHSISPGFNFAMNWNYGVKHEEQARTEMKQVSAKVGKEQPPTATSAQAKGLDEKTKDKKKAEMAANAVRFKTSVAGLVLPKKVKVGLKARSLHLK